MVTKVFVWGKKGKIIYRLETIAALGLKVAWSIQLNELMKLSIKGQGYSFTLVKGHSDFKVKCLTFGLYTQVSDSGPHALLFHLLWCLFLQTQYKQCSKKQ